MIGRNLVFLRLAAQGKNKFIPLLLSGNKKNIGHCGKSCYICTPHRGVEQLVARWAHNPKVVSSSLTPATIDDGN